MRHSAEKPCAGWIWRLLDGCLAYLANEVDRGRRLMFQSFRQPSLVLVMLSVLGCLLYLRSGGAVHVRRTRRFDILEMSPGYHGTIALLVYAYYLEQRFAQSLSQAPVLQAAVPSLRFLCSLASKRHPGAACSPLFIYVVLWASLFCLLLLASSVLASYEPL